MLRTKETNKILLVIAKLLFLMASAAIPGSQSAHKRALRKAGAEIALLQKEMEK